MPSYGVIAKPSTSYHEIHDFFSHLLINASGDHLSINSDDDFLRINDSRDTPTYTTISKPSTSYTTINKPS